MRTPYRIAASALGWFAIVLYYSLVASTRSGPQLVTWTVNFFSYFTIVGNILVALAMGLPALAPNSALGRWFSRPSVRTVITACIIVVGVVYYLLLSGRFTPQGWRLFSEVVLHYVTPTLFVLDWLMFVPKNDLSWRVSVSGLVVPAIYLAWTLLHGAYSGFYPYYFINVTRLGYEQVLLTIAVMVAGFVCIMLALVGIGRLLSARSPAARSVDPAQLTQS
jgi:hypothetical protein